MVTSKAVAISRRRWLGLTAASIGAACVAGQPLQRSFAALLADEPRKTGEESSAGHIDAHSHVWSSDVKRWPLVNGQTRADLKPLSFTPEELLALAEPEGVRRVVLIQHSTYHLWDNSYLIDCTARYRTDGPGGGGRFAIVGMVDDRGPMPAAKLRELIPQGVRGLRITPRIHGPTWLDSPGMESLWRCGAETGAAMCCLIDPSQFARVNDMCAKHPETPVVIDHFGRVGVDGTIRETDLTALCDLAKHKNVAIKLSAYYALAKKQPPYDDLIPMIRRVLDAFGCERCMWASDAPYQVQPPHTYAASIGLVRDRVSGLSAGDKDWLLRKTAERVFFS
jgi:predicted TIM-barrel fold metal-dependent hydrolase